MKKKLILYPTLATIVFLIGCSKTHTETVSIETLNENMPYITKQIHTDLTQTTQTSIETTTTKSTTSTAVSETTTNIITTNLNTNISDTTTSSITTTANTTTTKSSISETNTTTEIPVITSKTTTLTTTVIPETTVTTTSLEIIEQPEATEPPTEPPIEEPEYYEYSWSSDGENWYFEPSGWVIDNKTWYTLCNCVANEAGAYWISDYDKALVCEVIFNRLWNWGYNSVYDVVAAPAQFTGSENYVNLENEYYYKVNDGVIQAVAFYCSWPEIFNEGYHFFYGDGYANHFR